MDNPQQNQTKTLAALQLQRQIQLIRFRQAHQLANQAAEALHLARQAHQTAQATLQAIAQTYQDIDRKLAYLDGRARRITHQPTHPPLNEPLLTIFNDPAKLAKLTLLLKEQEQEQEATSCHE